ncbi:MAG: DUF2779 domain-containing protein [Caulobacteraceae bacterium]
MTRRFGLSKSKIAAFEQCPKRLWLQVHRPELAKPGTGAEARFATGHEVGAIACGLLPDGVMVEADPNLAAALATTQALLEGGHDRPIFEATLEHDGVLVRIDVLEPDGNGWRMAEVKSSTKPKDYHLGDLATQLWVAREAGVTINEAAVRHIDNNFVLERYGDFDGLLTDTDLTAQAETLAASRADLAAAARTMLAGQEPDASLGDHCKAPFACEFVEYCSRALPSGPEWPVTILPNGGGRRWLEQGIGDLLEIDRAALTNAMHRRVHEATATGETFHNANAARAAMADWAFPRTWLDFETIQFAIPRWIGARAYQQIPFQFSAHVEGADGAVEHREFLSLDGKDPRRPCAEALVAMVPEAGAVISYNAAFERGRILELAGTFPDLADRLEAIAARIVDLLPVTRACWYHRDQRGSWSIKAVLPTIAPELDYADLEVADGGAAQQAYLEAVADDTNEDRRATLDAALRLYCGRDTEAMLLLARRLCDG